jgi:serine/threonine-protein kinase HipA
MDTFVFLFLDNAFVPVGKMRFLDRGRDSSAAFAYGARYIKQPNAVSIDPFNLPLTKGRFQTEQGCYLFAAIRDAGPDLWGRYLLDRKFGRSLNELEYILASGPDRVGALAFGTTIDGPEVYGPHCGEPYGTKYLDIGTCLIATEDAVTDGDSPALKRLIAYGPSLGGARPKATVIWQDQPFLAKFSTSLDSRNEPALEYATMALAKQAGLNVPPIELLRANGRSVYLIKRFDRVIDERGSERPLHFLSGLTAINCRETDYNEWSYQRLVQAINRQSDQPELDRRELFRRMVFNILVNNDDDHPRNHGFISPDTSTWRLSPLYDVVPRDQRTSTFRLALNIGAFGKEASRANAISAADYFMIDKQDALTLWDELSSIIEDNWEETFSSAGLSEEFIDRFRGSIGNKD